MRPGPVLAVALALSSPIAALQEAPETEAASVEERYAHEIELAERLGGLLVAQHRLVEEAMEAAKLVVDPTELDLVVRPVVVVRDGRFEVRFVGRLGDRLGSLFDVAFSAEGQARVVDHGRPQPLDEEEGRRFQAVTVALRAMSFRCGERYESIVLPSPEGSGWVVHLFARGEDDDDLVLGGHFRAQVNDEATRVERIEPLSRACLEDPPRRPEVEPAERWVMNPLTPTPLESHVFLSSMHGERLIVGTWEGAWTVEDGEIHFAFPWGGGRSEP